MTTPPDPNETPLRVGWNGRRLRSRVWRPRGWAPDPEVESRLGPTEQELVHAARIKNKLQNDEWARSKAIKIARNELHRKSGGAMRAVSKALRAEMRPMRDFGEADPRFMTDAQLQDMANALLRAQRYDWAYNARPEQRMPNLFEMWLILAGRGWGKTRAGSEAVREVCEEPNRRIAVIAKDHRALRDVCFDGVSGLNACIPAELIKDYRRGLGDVSITLHNGSKIFGYTAGEPDAVRGQSFDFCIAEGEPVVTDRGNVPVECVRVGDHVLTRGGWRIVHASWLSRRAAACVRVTTDHGSVTLTPDHKVWTQERGWVEAQHLIVHGDTLVSWRMESLTPKLVHPRISVGPVVAGTSTSGPATTATATVNNSTERSGSRLMARFPMVTRSTMSISTDPTMLSRICAACRSMTTWFITAPCGVLPTTAGSASRRPRSIRRRSNWAGSDARRTPSPFNASVAGLTSSRPACAPSTAAVNACRKPHAAAQETRSAVARNGERASARPSVQAGWTASPLSLPARSAAPSSIARRLGQNGVLDLVGHGLSTAAVRSVEPAGRRDVYDLAVEGEHEFFAGCILVHNCWGDEFAAWPKNKAQDMLDQAQMCLRESDDARMLLTTTPKRVEHVLKMIKMAAEDPSIVVTRGSMRDNTALSEKAKAMLYRQHAGTRLGRQELEGELVLDLDNALWTGAMIEAAIWTPEYDEKTDEYTPMPKMVGVMTGVDPSGSSDGDATGIVTIGWDSSKTIWVLDNATCAGSPAERYTAACMSAFKHGASEYWVESAYGGDNIIYVLGEQWKALQAEGKIPIEAKAPWARASTIKGDKAHRAGPVVRLYEQQMNLSEFRNIWHLEPTLENNLLRLNDELLSWETDSKKSPNAMDALVHVVRQARMRLGFEAMVGKAHTSRKLNRRPGSPGATVYNPFKRAG